MQIQQRSNLLKTLNEALGSIRGEVRVAAQNLVCGLLIDTFNIIITPFDLFGEGRYCYTFHARCDENPSLVLEDGATRIFLNTRGTNRNEVSEELIISGIYGAIYFECGYPRYQWKSHQNP